MLQLKINNNRTYSVDSQDGTWFLDGSPVQLDIKAHTNGLINVLYNGKSYTAILEKLDHKTKEAVLRINGSSHSVQISEPLDQLLSSMGLDMSAMVKIEPVKAPMPGMILRILVEPGQQVNKGDGLLILEAMKMENVLKATTSATVKSVRVTEKTAVEKGAVLIELE